MADCTASHLRQVTVPLRCNIKSREVHLHSQTSLSFFIEVLMVNKRGRDSGSGQFIPIDEAKRRPKETEVEVIPPPKKPTPTKPKSK